jgi:glutamate racemase
MSPIGMLDSGLGGLSILREVRRLLPHEDVLYFADQAHVPYGVRDIAEIRDFVRAITRFFLQRHAKAVVIACNAASAAALHHVREVFPRVPFVGMEPAVKPAAASTRAGAIGVLTTAATYQGELFASVVDQFAKDVRVVTQVCPEFVTLVEAGELDGPRVREVARTYLEPVLASGVDQLVLGCTHFPFLTKVLQEIAGPEIAVVDPSAAIARQTTRVISDYSHPGDYQGASTFFTSGDPEQLQRVASHLLEEPIAPEQVVEVHWIDGTLVCV